MTFERPDSNGIVELDERSREIFRQIVESYLESGSPVGSRTLSRRLNVNLSPASIRNVMADLEASGLLYSPHTSAGRLPTQLGLRIFVDGLLQLGDLTEEERSAIEVQCSQSGRSMEEMLSQASEMLSGLTHAAGVVVVPKNESPLKHIEFVSLSESRALVVIVTEGGTVENRIIEVPPGVPSSILVEAANYLNTRLRGRTLAEAREEILAELEAKRAELDGLTAKLVEAGLVTWGGGAEAGPSGGTVIVRGRANLLDDINALGDLERLRRLLEDLESNREFVSLLERAHDAQGVRIFIGSENKLFGLSGSALIVSPYENSRQEVIGAIGVIGPTHLNYARIIPMVDYTARVIGRLIG